jgi:sphinganine-1-phosphate aldolase
MHQKYKWTLSKVQYPTGGHLVVTDANWSYWKEFIPCLQNCIEELRKNPELNDKGDAAMYGMAAKIPDKSLIDQALTLYMDVVLDVQ